MERQYTVCAAHVAPIYLEAAKTTAKACSLIAEAARAGARLIAFPESYIPGFPLWAAVQAPLLSHDLFKRLAANSLRVPGPEMLQLAATARQHQIWVSMGFSEATTQSVGCLWNSNVLISADGAIVNHHRKLVPTFFEKLIWANGDGAGLRVCDTPLGRLGALICGENTNPLARYALMAQGEQLHISSYPPTWPTRPPAAAGRYDLANAIKVRAGAHAFEAKAFNVVAAGALDRGTLTALESLGSEAIDILEQTPRGTSLVLNPAAEVISEVMAGDEGLLYCPIDLDACIEPKQFHDVVGYYNRFDVFHLSLDTRPLRPLEIRGDEWRSYSFESLEQTAQHPTAEGAPPRGP